MRTVLLAALVLVTTPVLAAEPDFTGKWSEVADVTCREPLLLTATTMEALFDESWQCQLPATRPGAREWTMSMQCAQEGTDYRQTQTWKLTGETLGAQRLAITAKTGTTVYKRCGLSKAGAARRS